jgi:signal transduction histidine kinase/DNA-binding LacI/PurR family transcriptional regulator/AraC-like DNA-binding protein
MQKKNLCGRPTIGVLTGWQYYRTATNLSYLAPVFRGISRAARDLGCNLLLGCGIGPSASPSDPLRPAWPVLQPDTDFVPIGPWNTDGILVANPLHSLARSSYIQELISQGQPVLFIGSGETGPTIVADNAGGIQEALRHLVDHGHRQIAFLAGSPMDMSGDSGDRLTAYQSFLQANNLSINPQLIAYGRHVYDGGYSAMQQILATGIPFTAVLASNDESALGAMQALEEAGHKIPQEVAVIGFDNRLEGAVHEPGLSSVHVPLFDMGYQALKLLHDHLVAGARLNDTIRISTRLVRRESCGCRSGMNLPAPGIARPAPSPEQSMAAILQSQAHSLTDREILTLCERLVESFHASIREASRSHFQNTLMDVLQKSMAVEDDAHIWQEAISVLGADSGDTEVSRKFISELLDEARLTISTQMQKQYRQSMLRERWTSSRLSLLTDRLLEALDDSQIYETLESHLPELNIHTAHLVQFEAQGTDPVAWSTAHNVLDLDQPLARFPTREFPPPGMLDENCPRLLTLVPLTGYSGQMGFMVFGSEPLDLYGAIVQQLGGAFNMARLYHQAVEDRQLAEEASQLKSRFLSTISHELRTPLNLIVGLSGLLLQENGEKKYTLPDSAHRDVERIHAYAQHLGGLIGDVLDLAANDAGQLRLNKEFMDLGDALGMIAESGRQLASAKGLAWRVNLHDSGPWVWGDRTRLRQVTLNLVNNAIKFTDQGEVSLQMEVGEGVVTVLVHDTGLGIPLEEQTTIFSEFSRSERSITLGFRGLGLGLAICKRLVEMHGGAIGVHSPGKEGEGSTFYFTLPTIESPPLDGERRTRIGIAIPAPAPLKRAIEPSALAQALDQQGSRLSNHQPARTVLIVDDETNTLELHARIVQAHSPTNRVLTAQSGLEALDALEHESIDLVLLDLQMQDLDGFRLLEQMREDERMRRIPVIVVTGKALSEADMGRMTPGVASILEKGLFSLDETVAHMNAALDRKHRLSGEAQRLVRKAMAFIHERFAEPITRREIARHVSIAEDYLTYCFRQELGTTPIKYLQRYRVYRARILLRESDATITEIARLVGFSDSGYFSRIFRRETGMPPEAFRRS